MTFSYPTARDALESVAFTLRHCAGVGDVLMCGSVASGTDDLVSDLDVWVESADWTPEAVPGLFLGYQHVTIGGMACYHGVAAGGLLLDVMVGPEAWPHYKPIDITSNAAAWAVGITEPSDLFTDFWINSFKARKPFHRSIPAMCLFGLPLERGLLFRAWVREATGEDPGPGAMAIHGLQRLIGPHLTPERWELLGLPVRSGAEILDVIHRHRRAMQALMPRPSALMELTLADPVFSTR